MKEPLVIVKAIRLLGKISEIVVVSGVTDFGR